MLSGNLVDPATGNTFFGDSTSTGVCNLGCPFSLPDDPGTTVSWGDGPFPINHSTVTFVGTPFTDVAPDQVFELGRLTYTNGTSLLGTGLFGATLRLQALDNSGAVITDPFDLTLAISTTQNTGATPEQNADFLDFGTGTFGSVNRVSFNVLEEATATAILYGSIVGDPQLSPSSVVLDPASVGSGFIGAGVPPVPEPATQGLLAVGLAALRGLRRRWVKP